MILYFADRQMNIIGQASTALKSGTIVQEDLKTEDIETSVATFTCRIPYSAENRLKVEAYTACGNYIFRDTGDGEGECYTIIEQESKTDEQAVDLYAEDAGLDLINDIALPYPDPEMDDDEDPHTIDFYIEKWTAGSGFEIGFNEVETAIACTFDSEQTVTERLQSLAEQFECAISFSFIIDRFVITNKLINVHQRRGSDVGIQLRLGYEINSLTVKKTISNLATALLCTGATEGSVPLNLDGYEYDDGEFYVDGAYLKSRSALAKWGRYYQNGEVVSTNDVVRTFSYDTLDQALLCTKGIEELKKICDQEVNYEADIAVLPDGVRLGDTVYVVDDAGDIYLSARILKLETSVSDASVVATLGDYLIQSSGISERVSALASQFAQQAEDLSRQAAAAQATADSAQEVANNTLIYDHTYEIDNNEATFTAYLYQGGIDVKTETDENDDPKYPPESFTWYYKTTDGELQPLDPGYGYTQTVDISDMDYGGHVVGRFTSTADSQILDESDNTITDSNDTPVTGRTESGETIRLSDFSVATTLYPTEKVLIVGNEDEHLVTIQTLQDYLNANLDKQVLFDTTAGWDAQTTLVSDANTLYIYTDHQRDSGGNAVAGIKAGDGLAYVVDLPFTDAVATEHIADTTRHITAAERAAWNNHVSNSTIHVTASDKEKWDSAVKCYYAGTEQLVFTIV